MNYRIIMRNIDGAGQNNLLPDIYNTAEFAKADARNIWLECNIGELGLGPFAGTDEWYEAIDSEAISRVIVFADGFVEP